jgi:hypothetical protein
MRQMSRSGFLNDQRLVREVRAKPDAAIDRASWPADVPAVAAVLESGLELPEGVTFLLGENGSGKSSGGNHARLLHLPEQPGGRA